MTKRSSNAKQSIWLVLCGAAVATAGYSAYRWWVQGTVQWSDALPYGAGAAIAMASRPWVERAWNRVMRRKSLEISA